MSLQTKWSVIQNLLSCLNKWTLFWICISHSPKSIWVFVHIKNNYKAGTCGLNQNIYSEQAHHLKRFIHRRCAHFGQLVAASNGHLVMKCALTFYIVIWPFVCVWVDHTPLMLQCRTKPQNRARSIWYARECIKAKTFGDATERAAAIENVDQLSN